MTKTSASPLSSKTPCNPENLWQPERLAPVYFDDLRELFKLSEHGNWPTPNWLTDELRSYHNNMTISFEANEAFADDTRYYEQIIYDDKRVPTRTENWHDLFNGLSWTLFPETKLLLNRQHMEDINQFGLNPRTKRRNRITHFDECGVVLAVANPSIASALAEHQWTEAFYNKREEWGTHIRAFVFGHANYEMLLSPFLGLTAKWVSIDVTPSFFDLPLGEQYKKLDGKLAEKVDSGLFSDKNGLKPLPLLGIPGWHKENCHPEFYDNTDYFRPKRGSR